MLLDITTNHAIFIMKISLSHNVSYVIVSFRLGCVAIIVGYRNKLALRKLCSNFFFSKELNEVFDNAVM